MSNPNNSTNHDKPLIGISIGDVNGISPEVIIKALIDPRILRFFTPVVYGSSKIFGYYRKVVDQNFNYHQVRDIESVHTKKVNIYNIWEDTIDINPGKNDPATGTYALQSLQKISEDLKAGKLDGVVTCPINKDHMQSEEFNFPGHTEYFAKTFGDVEPLMLMIADKIRIGVATGHMPLKDVPANITEDLLNKKLHVLIKTLKEDFGIQKPKIAVIGLNPHAGENGLLGTEETEIIQPVVESFKNKGQLVFGPFPADGFFGTMAFKKFDAILAMYHDQGLTPFKYMAFENGVNYTAGLPIVRTSPDHGTAYDIAGKNLANENSLREALYLAAEIINQRKGVPAE